MPTYRRARLIGLTIQSILDQSYGDFELLIRDDGREGDGTEEAVRLAASGDARVRYHRNPKNLGMPHNLNAGIEASTGELIAVCHDHDLFAKTYLERLVGLLDTYPTALFAHCGIEIVDQEGKSLGDRYVGPWAPLTEGRAWMAVMLRSFNCPVCALTLVRREAHERHGLYHPAYGFIADVEMWLRLAEHGDVAFAAEPLVRVRTREDDHAVTADTWPVLASSLAIHRRYVPRRYHGLEGALRRALLDVRADATIAREIASRLRRGRPVAFGKSAARIREGAGPMGKALATLLSLRS
jgi:glycosyltransferase involved in cell wall biosynthesis